MTEGGAMPEERRVEPLTCSLCNTLALLGLITMWTSIAEVTPQCSTEITEVVEDYLNAIRRVDTYGCILYTPSLTSYEQKCPNSTLTCFAEEVKVLIYEFEEDQAFQDPGLFKDLPKRLMSVNKEDREHCLQCEVHDAKPAEEFLLELKTVLEMMNSGCG
ncbi:interleukin 15, like isoform X3 [Paramormyrops kingsleyae]|uniref:interleukin 15, like isoform X3 n=1 Tax=Paramormyrops kingsleyae TaxID=1676925 RepID=UPI003B97B2DB